MLTGTSPVFFQQLSIRRQIIICKRPSRIGFSLKGFPIHKTRIIEIDGNKGTFHGLFVVLLVPQIRFDAGTLQNQTPVGPRGGMRDESSKVVSLQKMSPTPARGIVHEGAFRSIGRGE